MESHSIDSKRMTESPMTSDNNLQKPNIYNKFSPFYEFINEQSSMLFDEIRENLSRTIQLGEFEPGFTIWSNKLTEFLIFYGFNFTKINHLKLINFYLSILSITDLNYRYVQICLDMLFNLMRFVLNSFDIKEQNFCRKTRLITRNDLTIDWRILYNWAKVIYDNHDENHSLVIPPKFL
jgi:hypothetical protein